MPLAFDLTPTTINRTAIFHIALDTAMAFQSSGCFFRYGRKYMRYPVRDIEQLNSLRNKILPELFQNGGLIKERWLGMMQSTHRRPSNVDKIFYFDPLYLLFENVASNDVVLVLDLSPLTNPEWHNPRVCELYRIAFERMVASGAHIVSISDFTARALWANFGVPLDSVTVVPLYLRGSLMSPLKQMLPIEKRLLCVGSLETRKNIRGLISAFNLSGLAAEGYELCVAGGNGHGVDDIRASATDVPGVHLLGYVSDDELRRLYATSSAYVYPSYLEGFGLPILEAAQAGLPILTSITGATAEVAPPGSVLVDPLDIFSIAEGLRKITSISNDERAETFKRNRDYVSRFTFERYIEIVRALCA